MEQMFTTASLWLGLAVISTVIAYHLRISVALIEVCIGVIAAAVANHFFGQDALGGNLEWLRFLATTGAVMLTFLAGAELDPKVMSTKKKEVFIVGLVGFLAPFLGCAAVARYLLHWNAQSSWLAGVALASTSTAVIYTVMLETGFNKTEFGKGILGASFVNDLGSVIVLGLLFAPFTYKTVAFVIISAVTLALFPFVTSFLTRTYGNKTAAIRAKWVVFVLFGLGALALWAGSLVSLPVLISGPIVFSLLFAGKVIPKIFGLYPVISNFRKERSEKWYYALMMSTGLTFGTISALYGFSHGIVSKEQYSFLVAAVIASAVIPTLIANFAFLPKHLLAAVSPKKGPEAGIGEE